ncbi:Fe-Mn family superoxide dismutase [Sphingobium sp. H39-3-25]|uniref:superoxide dismutase n=1 Tax=Sphingobium arseniciresistens TaxID=3030834 RepID=UPI0023B95526|nr:Fe-Mn family superoxide dismutase [Sphingobium arseniciresistens]
MSKRLLLSHHDNNYVGAVKRLAAISAQFAGSMPQRCLGFTINGLKREELIAWNSMILHELYFAGLGAASQPGRRLAQLIERDFGSHDRGAAAFAGMGKALGGGSGWVLLQWSHRDDRLTNQWAADHTATLAGSTPILALDMYEHAYALDYSAKAGDYVDTTEAKMPRSASTPVPVALDSVAREEQSPPVGTRFTDDQESPSTMPSDSSRLSSPLTATSRA